MPEVLVMCDPELGLEAEVVDRRGVALINEEDEAVVVERKGLKIVASRGEKTPPEREKGMCNNIYNHNLLELMFV